MASIRKHGTGWRAEVFRKGKRTSKVCATKTEAKAWAARQEYLIETRAEEAPRLALGEVFQRYAREISPRKAGARWEQMRLDKMTASPLGQVLLPDLKALDFAQWRDARLKEVAPGSVRREMVLISSVLSIARKEWGLLVANPMEGVRWPQEPEARDRLVTEDELGRLAQSAGEDLRTSTARVFHAFLFALETAMRIGEILRVRAQDIDRSAPSVSLWKTKNGTTRTVPLSRRALELLDQLPKVEGDQPLFAMSASSADALWRKLRDRAGVEDLTFHDSRHAAITRLSRKLDVLALARMVGHRDIKQLMSYYNETAAELAKRLD